MRGKVIWFNNAKGFGFLSREDGEKDVFVHHSGINAEGYRSLKAEQLVEFSLEDGPQGPQATGVTVVG